MRRLSESVRSTYTDGGTIVLDVQGGRIFHLNATGSWIFRHLQKGQSESQIIHGISDEFGISLSTAHKDVCDFFRSMEQAGLVHNDASRGSL
jgi:Coenzyme PQQ synthesis protein D (PqqD)